MAITQKLRPLQRLFRLLSVDRKEITQVYIYALFNGLVNLTLPLGIQAIINLIQGGEVSAAWILLVILVVLGIVFTGILQLLQLRLVENLSQKIFSRASFELAYRFPRIRFQDIYNYYAPELANRFFDTLTIQKGLPKILIDFSLAVFTIFYGLIVLSMYHPFFILFGVALVALVYTLFVYLGPRGVKTSLLESKHKYNVAHWIEEIARTKMSFKLVDDPEVALKKTDNFVNKYLDAREGHFKVLVYQFWHLIGFKMVIAAGLLLLGGILVFRQEMNIGQFVAAEIIIILIINAVEKLIRSLESIYDVLTALEKIGYVTDMPLDKEDGLCFEDSVESIECSISNLDFTFPDASYPVLKNVNLTIPGGRSVVIMGPSGSGKSTLMGLMAGIFKPDTGVIKYNGLSLQSLNFASLKKHIGFSLSNNQIFTGTLMENIVMERTNCSLSAVLDAVEMVNLKSFINTLPDGLNTPLNPEAQRIPRSVANKIILARAIVTRPKLLILEDPLDHVPAAEKETIIEQITSNKNPWSIIITTVDNLWAEYIEDKLILENGEVKYFTFEKE